jgi:hypothetical protein
MSCQCVQHVPEQNMQGSLWLPSGLFIDVASAAELPNSHGRHCVPEQWCEEPFGVPFWLWPWTGKPASSHWLALKRGCQPGAFRDMHVTFASCNMSFLVSALTLLSVHPLHHATI